MWGCSAAAGRPTQQMQQGGGAAQPRRSSPARTSDQGIWAGASALVADTAASLRVVHPLTCNAVTSKRLLHECPWLVAATPIRLCSAHLECSRRDTWRAADSSKAPLRNSQSALPALSWQASSAHQAQQSLPYCKQSVPSAVQQTPTGPTCWAATVRCRCAARDLCSSASPLLLTSWNSACLRAPCTHDGDELAEGPQQEQTDWQPARAACRQDLVELAEKQACLTRSTEQAEVYVVAVASAVTCPVPDP